MSLLGNVDPGTGPWDELATQPDTQPTQPPSGGSAEPMDTAPQPSAQSQPAQPETETPSDAAVAQRLFEAVVALGWHADGFQSVQEQQNRMLEAITTRLEVLETAPQRPATSAAVHTTVTPRATAPKVREPRMYSGKASDVVPFLREIRAAVYLQRAGLPTDYDKSLYFSMYLKDGTPMSCCKKCSAADS
ncbi:hypothetical protein OBBRIDRAFT_808703 [Obba rivulosa]|uniref:Uncharacterized protein n=1 Tax=Obba rivulosa TaxID=1052685 RepID=A0A8E2ANG9_9APHY|nr:hypothetical protein OBBRIDRAFT_808703 [Obba rivulosa]